MAVPAASRGLLAHLAVPLQGNPHFPGSSFNLDGSGDLGTSPNTSVSLWGKGTPILQSPEMRGRKSKAVVGPLGGMGRGAAHASTSGSQTRGPSYRAKILKSLTHDTHGAMEDRARPSPAWPSVRPRGPPQLAGSPAAPRGAVFAGHSPGIGGSSRRSGCRVKPTWLPPPRRTSWWH